MSVQPNLDVEDFVRRAVEMLRVLRSQGHELSDLDLHKLTTHLHLLEIESTNLQALKKLQPVKRAAGEAVEMVKEREEVIREYMRASEAVLELADLSEEEEAAVADMLFKVSNKLYPEGTGASHFAARSHSHLCALSGPVKIGKDTYMTSKPGSGYTSAGSLKADLFREGNTVRASTLLNAPACRLYKSHGLDTEGGNSFSATSLQ